LLPALALARALLSYRVATTHVNVSLESPEGAIAQAVDDSISCSYSNGRDRMVIVRCLGPDAFFLERVLFPFEQLSFQCPAGSDVEIWSHSLGGPELVEQFPAETVICCCV
jgi:hypothetical protein